ncbi:hypothetical protein BKG93_09875 [Rodentibacter ratti]|uniref:Uncharacterized protein n=1 Tax=Rodentibacter ratti TaxID=1906745 RepID=A0A1V3L0P7_9PAST|nr:hypothetical protein [Rodentibacter ratti]OOF83517.1 hypothetical protein BKG93_09875 [Rodentibacter ratti]
MIKFNLEQALQGAPVRLNNGFKAYIFADVSNLAPGDLYPLMGGYAYEVRTFNGEPRKFVFGELRWTEKGENDRLNTHFNIQGMWED